MKKTLLPLLLLCFFTPLVPQTRITPDCSISFNFTATGSTSNSTCGAPNGQANGQGIASWVLVYYSTGYSAISIVVQSAPDSAGVPGSYVTFAGTVLTSTQYPGSSGANPNTATTSAFTGFAGYYPWMRVTLASVTGTGSVRGNLYGFYNSTLARAGGGSGTPSGPAGGDLGSTYPNPTVLHLSHVTDGSLANSGLANSSTTVNGTPCTLGASCSPSAAPSGSAGGDLSGTYPNPTVAKVNGNTPGGTCGGGQFVNVISTSAVPTCATPAGGGGSGGGTSGWSGLPLTFAVTTTQFSAPVGGALTSATESVVQLKASASATISGLQVTLSAALGVSATLAVTFRDGASSTPLTCITASGGTTCTDTTHSVNVTQGDLLSFQLVSSGGVTAGLPQIEISYAVGTSGVGLISLNTATGPNVTLFATNAQTSTYQVLASDFVGCKTIPVASGTFTITLVASGSQPPSGQCITILNYGTGVITLARSGQHINGATANLTGTAGSATAPTGWYVVSDATDYVAEVIGGGGGGSIAVIHHQYFTAATTDNAAGIRSNLNGSGAATFLTPIMTGVLTMAASNTSNLTVFIPSTWDGSAIPLTANASTSSNGTGNYSFTPAYACIPNGTDLGVSYTYTSGSTVTQAAPGGSGSGFYQEMVPMSVTPTGCAGESVNIKVTRGGADTYGATMYFIGVDVAIKY
jgi:hypothetical protein